MRAATINYLFLVFLLGQMTILHEMTESQKLQCPIYVLFIIQRLLLFTWCIWTKILQKQTDEERQTTVRKVKCSIWMRKERRVRHMKPMNQEIPYS